MKSLLTLSLPSRGQHGEPGSPDAKFEEVRKFSKNQRSLASRRRRRDKRRKFNSLCRSNFRFVRTQLKLKNFSWKEIKSKMNCQRRDRRTGILYRGQSHSTKSGLAPSSKLTVSPSLSSPPISSKKSKSFLLGQFNVRSIKSLWKRLINELILHNYTKI